VIKREAKSHRAYAWSYTSDKGKATQLPHGAIFVQSKVLCTDFNQSGFYQSLLNVKKRTSRSVKTLIGPWAGSPDRNIFEFIFQSLLMKV